MIMVKPMPIQLQYPQVTFPIQLQLELLPQLHQLNLSLQQLSKDLVLQQYRVSKVEFK